MVYVLLVDGFEEVEAFTPVDMLRRCGVELKTVGIYGKTVIGSHGVPVIADILPEEVSLENAEMVILPGGPGTPKLNESPFVHELTQYCFDHDRYVTAICAAPSVILGGMGLLAGKRATGYPGKTLTGAEAMDVPCIADGKLITGRAAADAMAFSIALCAALCGGKAAEEVGNKVCYSFG